ncbi:hypothetical protein B0F90DRAFT_1787917 [Multifurca ochricompacta]|uniref:Uncharacterized protein n=1 Tax=Multifurca ochricompacta TaxID=376703 RepID=A0AAD4LTB0_9AGAM|nr:hypothetical protein B0F90DRAFT_1787917 [Multifurca ochricompacta]
MSENQPLFAIALHARNHSRTHFAPYTQECQPQRTFAARTSAGRPYETTSIPHIANTAASRTTKAAYSASLRSPSTPRITNETPTLYTEWINTALDDLRDPGVWAEVTRFCTATNDLDVTQQAVTATRKQIEITVQKVRTPTQELTRRNAYHRIYPHLTYLYAWQDRIRPNKLTRFTPHLEPRAVLQEDLTTHDALKHQRPRKVRASIRSCTTSLKLEDWTILDNHPTTARAATTNPAATDIQRRLGANVSLQKG